MFIIKCQGMSGRDSAMSGLLLPTGPIPGFPGKKPSLSRSESVHSVRYPY